MKKLVALILALVMVLGISAAFADEYHFEIVSKGFQSTYWQAVLKGAKEEVDKINAEGTDKITMNFVGPDSESDVAQQVQQFTSQHALRFTNRYYRPDNAVFFVYGDIDFARLVRGLKVEGVERRAEGGGLKAESRKQSAEREAETTAAANSTLCTLHSNHHQAHVMLGCQSFSYDDPRRITLFLLNNILGGPGMNARLNLKLREQHGLVYTVESTMASYSDTGVWSVYFGCDHHDVKRCIRLVNRELDRMMQAPLSDRQLAAAKRQLKGQLAIAADNREQFALDMAKHFLHYGKERSLDQLIAQIDAITAPQLQDVAQQLFAPEHMQQLIL